jgi:salicylate hydroxylase
MHRADLHGILAQACRRSGLATVRTGAKVVDLVQTDDCVVATLSDGQTVAGKALIGADGLWSSVRAALIGDGEPRASGHIAYRGLAAAKELPDCARDGAMTIWAAPGAHLVHYLLRDGALVNVVAVVAASPSHSEDEHIKSLAQTSQRLHFLLNSVQSWRAWPIFDREPIERWSQGRATLLGDAAHPMVQYLAQGACMAIEDALCLAGRIQETPCDVTQAFKDYEQARYLRTARVQLSARLFGELIHADGVHRELRDIYLRGRRPERSREDMAWLYDVRDWRCPWRVGRPRQRQAGGSFLNLRGREK